MGRTRRKKRVTQAVTAEEGGDGKLPKAFVIERGKVGHVLSQLVLDLRQIMEPNTASRLKVRHKNVLKDFVTVAGPLGVTHLLVVSRTADFVNMKVCVLPRGPTVTFHIKAFSLAKEVLSSLKAPAVNPSQFLTAPMLAMNNFNADDKVSHLLSTVFQNMFPSINVHSVNLADIRRSVLLNFDPDTNLIDLRHYATRVVPRGTSRGVKKLSRPKLPNMGKLSDISEFLLSGYASESDGEELCGGEGEVTLPQDLPGRANIKSEQSTVRLSELGPRLSLQLVKVEAGLCEGEVLHHAYVHKSREEKRHLRASKEGVRQLKEKRRRVQDMNVARKKKEREENKVRSLAGMKRQDGESDGEEDKEWFRKEVGEEPDPDTFGSGIRSTRGIFSKGRKRQASASSGRGRGEKRPASASGGRGEKRPASASGGRGEKRQRQDSAGLPGERRQQFQKRGSAGASALGAGGKRRGLAARPGARAKRTSLPFKKKFEGSKHRTTFTKGSKFKNRTKK